MKFATCHPDRKHHCKGLCSICYAESRRESIREWKRINKKRMLEQQHKYERELPDEVKANWRLHKNFGISLDDYKRMFSEQRGGCAICGRPPNVTGLPVDHSHKTGKVRGLLCRNCNHIMHVFDDLEKLNRFLRYAGRKEIEP